LELFCQFLVCTFIENRRFSQLCSLHPPTHTSPFQDEEYAEFPLAVTSLLTLDQKTILIGSEDGKLIVFITTEKSHYDFPIFSKALSCMTLNHERAFLASLDGRVAVMPRKLNLTEALSTNAFSMGNKTHDSGVRGLVFLVLFLGTKFLSFFPIECSVFSR
jgi:hypothetical protein